MEIKLVTFVCVCGFFSGFNPQEKWFICQHWMKIINVQG